MDGKIRDDSQTKFSPPFGNCHCEAKAPNFFSIIGALPLLLPRLLLAASRLIQSVNVMKTPDSGGKEKENLWNFFSEHFLSFINFSVLLAIASISILDGYHILGRIARACLFHIAKKIYNNMKTQTFSPSCSIFLPSICLAQEVWI